MDVFTGEYEYDIPQYRRIYAKDAMVETTETDARLPSVLRTEES